MAKTLRVGIVGTGFGARIQAPIFHLNEGFQVVALVSISGRYEQTEPEGPIVYAELETMIQNERLDLVSIAAAPNLHYGMTKYAMEQGLHVLCEKPMALDAKETAEMLQIQKATGKLGFIDFEWRYLPARMKIKEILKQGTLGRILHVRYQGNRDNLLPLQTKELGWHGHREDGGGVLNAVGSHLFDSLLWWLGEDVSTVTSQLSTYIPYPYGSTNKQPRTADQAFQVLGKFQSGTTFSAEFISGQRHKAYEWGLEVFGSNGSLIMKDDKEVQIAVGQQTFQKVELSKAVPAPPGLSGDLPRFYGPFSEVLDRVYKRICDLESGDDTPLFEDGHRVQLVLDAIRRSHLTGTTVPLE